MESIRKVISRSKTSICLQALIKRTPKCPFQQPRFLEAYIASSIPDGMSKHHIEYPIICKQLEACGTPNSHSMAIVVNEEGLRLLRFPCLVQQYFDHGGEFWKVYVIGDDVMAFKRRSLPDLNAAGKNKDGCFISGHGLKSVLFDSRFTYPTLEDFTNTSPTSSSHTEEEDSSYQSAKSRALPQHEVNVNNSPTDEDEVEPSVLPVPMSKEIQ